MIIRKTVKEDLKDVMQIINMARTYFKSQNINQWQGPYPCEEDIIKDIEDQLGEVGKYRFVGVTTSGYSLEQQKIIKKYLNH